MIIHGETIQSADATAPLPVQSASLYDSDLTGQARSSLSYLNNLVRESQGLENLSSTRTKERCQEAIQRNFIAVTERGIALLPLVVLPDSLVHLSLDRPLTKSGLIRNGVFGDPASNAPTYISSPNWRGETNAWSDWDPTIRNQEKISLTICSDTLLKSRFVYIDPESLQYTSGLGGGQDVLGEMFIVMGGIPKAAITKLYYPWGASEATRKSWGLGTDVT